MEMKIKLKAVSVILFVLLFLGVLTMVDVAEASPTNVALDHYGTPLIIDPTLIPGTQFTINMTLDYVEPDLLWAYQICLSFNASVLHGVSVENGPFMASNGGSVIVIHGSGFNNTVGRMGIFAAYLDPVEKFPEGGSDEHGALCTITFEVVGYGDSHITMGAGFPVGETLLGNRTGHVLISKKLNPECFTDAYFTNIGAPVALFNYSPSEPAVGETVTFNASASYDNDGYVESYDWDFGDGATDTGMIVTHVYATADTYLITLNVTDNDGLTCTSTQSITVAKLSSAISMSMSATNIVLGESTIISGSITPTRVGATVKIYNRPSEEETWNILTAIATDDNSQYSCAWMPSTTGTYEFKALWLGDADTLPAESSILQLHVDSPTQNLSYAELQSNLTKLELKVNNLESDKTNLELTVSDLESDRSNLQSQVDTLNSNITSLESEVTSLESEKTSLESQVSGLQSQITTARNLALVAIMIAAVFAVTTFYFATRKRKMKTV